MFGCHQSKKLGSDEISTITTFLWALKPKDLNLSDVNLSYNEKN